MEQPLRILIGITGGIAAYKVPHLVRLLRKRGADVKVVLTRNASGLVGEAALEAVSGNPVYKDEISRYDMDHIRLAQWADWFLISPATANTVAKIAHGIADNLLTSLALSIPETRIIVAPAMNDVMWGNAATQANCAVLKERGIDLLPVGEGELACATSGPGRMLEVEEIAEHILTKSKFPAKLKGRRVLISSGPTEEPLDPVRVITNRSSGKMGAALARAALGMGAEVVVVSGPAKEPLPAGARVIRVGTALEMKNALEIEFGASDICIMAAAVSDFRPVKYSESKIPREEGGTLSLELTGNPDILESLGKRKSTRFIAGFSLEVGDDERRARLKMQRKGCDLMVLNTAGNALGTDTTQFTMLFPDGTKENCPMVDKGSAACFILERIAECVGSSHG